MKSAAERGKFRPDVEGLRGVAIAFALLYHAGHIAPGGYIGVDIFFVISGFLITGMLVDELRATGTISLTRFYSRRVKRLLPLVALVLGFVAIGSRFVLPPARQESVAGDIVGAGVYVINWRLVFRSVDYSGMGMQASPVQHFWSLAVEEQFYIVWPALLLLATWWWRRRGRVPGWVLVAVVAAVALASFAYNLHYTNAEAAAAYFSTATRGWELAFGGLLAFAARLTWRPGRWLGSGLAWGGLAALVWAGAFFNDSTPFPGKAALLPIVATLALILAGSARTASLPIRFLTLSPVRHVGRISYAWYLWHWPVIVFAAALWGDLTVWEGLLAIAVAYIPAVLSHRLVEQPLHYSRTLAALPRATLGLGVALTAISVAAGVGLSTSRPQIPVASASVAVGARALLSGQPMQQSVNALSPPPDKAYGDRGRLRADGCLVPLKGDRSPPCVYGVPSSRTTVVLFGDSHAMQYFPALNPIAVRRGWRLVGLTKGGCTPALVRVYQAAFKREYSECDRWRERALERIASERPSMIVVSGLDRYRVLDKGRAVEPEESGPLLEAGFERTLRRLKSTGAKVVVIRDNPHPGQDIPSCVSQNIHHLENCAIDRSKGLDYYPSDERAARAVPGVHLISPVPVLCGKRVCPAVIGNVLVYRNTTHLTATFARTLSPWLEKKLPAPARSR
jgi:peptidoglycan/LPS O-acetylase OafA/YrhL